MLTVVKALIVLLAVVSSVAAHATPASATGGEGEAWPSFTESSACGAQRISTPHAESTGGLPTSYFLRGEFGAFFGRTVQDVFDSLEPWTVPGSNKTLTVHPFLLDALDGVTANLANSLEGGPSYRIDPSGTFATVARTIGGSLRISRHSYGIAFDINSTRNPYRSDNELITDMPEWWVGSFLDAGFCWGGLWIGSKDAMHFAWQGPAFSGYDKLPLPHDPVTSPKEMGLRDVAVRVEPRAEGSLLATVLADGTGNGATDIVRVSSSGSDILVDVSMASRNHNACSSRTSIVAGLDEQATAARAIGFGDWDGRGGQDLWLASASDGMLHLTVRWAFGGYAAETSARTEVPAPSDDAWISTADFDANGALDLIVVDAGQTTVWEIDPWSGATSQLLSFASPFDQPDHWFIGDRDRDLLPDLWAIVDGRVRVALAADGYLRTDIEEAPIGIGTVIEDVVAADYDGDGTLDVITFDGTHKRVWLGNEPLPDGLPLEVWFEAEEPECADGEPTWERSELRFSTSGWVAVGSYGWRERHGLENGCNPEDDGCAIGTATRQDFAEFLAWIDGLAPASIDDVIAAARSLDIAGYALPCSMDDRACWTGPMLRSELASYFGQFMAERRGDVPQPHRWVVPSAVDDVTLAPYR